MGPFIWYGFLLSWQFWQAWAPKIIIHPDSNLNFFLSLENCSAICGSRWIYSKIHLDLNPKCKEGSIPIMQLGVLLGFQVWSMFAWLSDTLHFLSENWRENNRKSAKKNFRRVWAIFNRQGYHFKMFLTWIGLKPNFSSQFSWLIV